MDSFEKRSEPQPSKGSPTSGATNGRFEGRAESVLCGDAIPACVAFIYHDEQGRRCTQFVATCESANRNRNEDAKLIAALLNVHYGKGSPASGESSELGNHNCEYDSDGAPCNHCGRTAAEAIAYFERHLNKPQRSEPRGQQQEWTPEYVKQLIHEQPAFRDIYTRICDAHNAELAAERDNYALALQMKNIETKRANKAEKTASDVNRVCDQLASNLAAERQLVEWCEVHAPTKDEPIKCCPCCEAVHERRRREQAEADGLSKWRQATLDCADMNLKLLSALAAVRNLIQSIHGKRSIPVGEAVKLASSIDLSALHQHDAEVREPLVKALEKVSRLHGNDSVALMIEAKSIVRDARSEVKKQ